MRLLPILLLAATLAVPIDREPSHRLVLENPALKVYDVWLKPGGRSQFHAHPTPHAVVVISPARLRNEVKGKPPVDQYTGEAGKVLFLPAGPEHRQANVDRAPARWLALEFKGKPKASDILTRRLVLAPDQTATLPYDRDFLGIAITHARLEVSPGQRGKRVEMSLEAGTPTWYAKGAGMSLKNLGNGAVEMVFVKVK